MEEPNVNSFEMWFAIFDIKNLSKINYKYGWEYGDKILVDIKTFLENYSNSIESFIYSKSGSDEFIFGASQKSKKEFLKLVNEISKEFEKVSFNILITNGSIEDFKSGKIEQFLQKSLLIKKLSKSNPDW